jgi:hypothetical protein
VFLLSRLSINLCMVFVNSVTWARTLKNHSALRPRQREKSIAHSLVCGIKSALMALGTLLENLRPRVFQMLITKQARIPL